MYNWAEHGPFGGHPFLDFINTVDDEGKTRSMNAIPDWAAVLEWAVATSVLAPGEAERLVHLSIGPAASDELRQLTDFREMAWVELRRMAADQPADQENLDAIGETIRWALAHSTLESRDGSLRWSPRREDLDLRLIRARLALALFELTLAPEIGRLRECGRCTGLFLDRGRGQGRRWCRMTTCGNRAKIERFRSKP